MGTSQSAVARFEAGDLDVRLSTVERYTTRPGGEAGMEDRAWVTASMADRAQQWPWLPAPRVPAATGARARARAPLRDAGPPAAGPARRPAARPARRPDGDPGLGRADDARCGGRRARDPARRLRRGAASRPALTLMDVIELMGVPVRALCLGQVGAGAVGVVARVRPPGRHAEHPLLAVRAHDAAGGPRAQRGPVGRAAGGRAAALLRARRRPPSGKPAEAVEEDMERGRFLERGRGGRVRHHRRGVPARRRHPPPARAGSPPMGFRPLR